ncbi:MAG: hypothetical protein E6230_03565 [Paenibacillus dendritiformis]|uniref:hypothetical protein n=1 Tax=Paenibacillus dendritiformis TaxID=130049 RepID=UPI001B2392D5|nr:hypothetical protein [Paenibacillus dendritiformis]MDU5141248.1 hypothetical protein [Paenibacillus dendritiformis]GIO74377.1 hypothetical protein J27TS7_38910 [Paenibacillus dendritiformis]
MAKQVERQVQSLSRQSEKRKEEKKGFIKLLAVTEAVYKEKQVAGDDRMGVMKETPKTHYIQGFSEFLF